MKFKIIHDINDIKPFVSHKEEIKFNIKSNGTTIGCYVFKDSKTFDSLEALECRGIIFDASGKIISRPLHKFFNLGERADLTLAKISQRTDIAAIFEKIDGSMIATAWIDGHAQLRSVKSYEADVIHLADGLLFDNKNLREFCFKVASNGMTAIFELSSPNARIVVKQTETELRLLHVRDNVTGEYLLLDPSHILHKWIEEYQISTVNKLTLTIEEMMESLPSMINKEGYVIQFGDGDMVKIKCPWYIRLHRSVTFLRERDIALLALNGEIDDIKSALIEIDIDLKPILETESKVKEILSQYYNEIVDISNTDRHLPRKEFAAKHNGHRLFSLIISNAYYSNYDLEKSLKEWYIQHRLKQDFSLKQLTGTML